MITYKFTVQLTGKGEDLEDAWENAVLNAALEDINAEDADPELIEEAENDTQE